MSRDLVEAFHSAEIAYAFGRVSSAVPSRYEPADFALSKAMSSAGAVYTYGQSEWAGRTGLAEVRAVVGSVAGLRH
ncbi:MAG TPA: hypothetical protein VH559_16270 [Gemmatimonadaceae bacterium]